jgi:hypothetical protein
LIILLLTLTTTSTMAALRIERSPVALSAIAMPDASRIEQPPERSLVGTLDQVDPQATEFIIRTTSGKQRFVLESGATIRQGSKTIKASELAAHKGERVKVRYRESGGVRRAEWIVVASPARKSKTPVE